MLEFCNRETGLPLLLNEDYIVSIEQLEDCAIIVMVDEKEYEVTEWVSDVVAELKEKEEREEQIALVNNMTLSMLGQPTDCS